MTNLSWTHLVLASPEYKIVLLGSPIGSFQFVETKVMEKIQAVRDITIQLPLIKDPHSEFVLLRSCFSLPKLMFLLRSIDPTHHQELWRLFDRMI